MAERQPLVWCVYEVHSKLTVTIDQNLALDFLLSSRKGSGWAVPSNISDALPNLPASEDIECAVAEVLFGLPVI